MDLPPTLPGVTTVSFVKPVHGAVAAAELGGDEQLVQTVKTDWINADISLKMKALLGIHH